MTPRTVFTHVDFNGEHPNRERGYKGGTLVVDNQGIHGRKFTELVTIPWSTVTGFTVNGTVPRRKITVGKLLTLGVFALFSRKKADTFLTVTGEGFAVVFVMHRSSVAEVQARVGAVRSVAAGHAERAGLAPAGWMSDPKGVAALRWWDGTGWTDHTSG